MFSLLYGMTFVPLNSPFAVISFTHGNENRLTFPIRRKRIPDGYYIQL